MPKATAGKQDPRLSNHLLAQKHGNEVQEGTGQGYLSTYRISLTQQRVAQVAHNASSLADSQQCRPPDHWWLYKV